MSTNVEEVVISIKHELDSLHRLTPNPCIRKVPESMASVPMEPLVVSIGPLYYVREALKPFHKMKLRHLQSLLQHANDDFNLGQCVNIIREKEDEILSYYSERSSLSSNEFIKMILIDAAFIIFFFIKTSNLGLSASTHLMGNRIEVRSKVNHDLFLVENQLPFFVLYDVFHKAFGKRFGNITFKDVACYFISKSSLPGREGAGKSAVSKKLRDTSNIKHLVDCLRICCLPTTLRCNQLPLHAKYAGEFPKTAKELKEAGVEFIPCESKRLLDITFSKGVLWIPKLKIEDTTKAILRSMAIYEQCQHHNDSYIFDYLCFMHQLIDTSEDVQILVQDRIIKSALGSDEQVATLFTDVTKDLLPYSQGFYYAHLCQELNAYCHSPWNNLMTSLRRNYFNRPWSALSMINLLIILFLITLQVYYGTTLQVYYGTPRNK